jgi:hypothetical protein
MEENLVRLEAELAAVLHGLDRRQCQLTPQSDPGKWNVQQIVEHLVLSYRSTVALLEGRIEKQRPTQAQRSPQQHFGQFFLIRLGFFPTGVEAPAAVRPAMHEGMHDGRLDEAGLVARIHEALSCLDDRIKRARALFGSRPFASHIILGPLSASQWTRFHLVHGRHHIKQIRLIRRDHGV